MTVGIESLEGRKLLAAVIRDPTWSTAGNGEVTGTMIGLEPDGRLIAFGLNKGKQAVFLRYNVNGSIDPAFNVQPPRVGIGFLGAGWFEAATDGSGRIYSAYARDTRGDYHPDLARLTRYNADGTPDAAFGRTGEVEIAPPGSGGKNVYVQHLSVNASGQALLVASRQLADQTNQLYLARFTARGPIDTTWGDNGYLQLPSNTIVTKTFLQPDGSAFVFVGNSTDAYVLALDASGQPRTEYGPGGRFTLPTKLNKGFSTLLNIDAQGRVYVSVGQRSPRLYPNNQMPAGVVARSLTRLLPDGSIDASFGENGFVGFDVNGYSTATGVSTLTFDAQDRILLIAGNQLVRLTPDGQFDASFDFDGRADVSAHLNPELLPFGDRIYVGAGNQMSIDSQRESTATRYAPVGRTSMRADGRLVVAAQHEGTQVVLTRQQGRVRVSVDGFVKSYALKNVTGIEVHLSDGNDLFSDRVDKPLTVAAGAGNDRLDLPLGDHTIDTGAGDDTVTAGAGKDSFRNPFGTDTIDLGAGDSTINDISSAVRAVDGMVVRNVAALRVTGNQNPTDKAKLVLGQGTDIVTLADGYVSLANAGGDGNRFTLHTTLGAIVSLGAGSSTLDTFDGNDTVTSNGGHDRIRTRGGDDTVTAFGGHSTIDLGDGNDTYTGYDSINSVLGGAGRDTLHGSTRDTLVGGEG